MKKNILRIVILLLGIVLVYIGINSMDKNEKKAEGYYRIVVLSDTHLPLKTLKIKDNAKQDKIIAAKKQSFRRYK